MALAGIASSQEANADGSKKVTFSNILGAPGDTNCKYERIRKLGTGSFGEAWLVRRRPDNVKLAAKIMDLSQMSAKDYKYVESEVQCLASCNHYAIVKYYEDFTEGNFMLIIMEFADAGDLNVQIKGRAAEGYRYFEEHEIGYTFIQLAMAVDHIHRRKMLHRDIKGANVLLMSTGLIKLGDFGFSHMYDQTVSGAVAQTFCGTPYYLAPELWKRERYSKKADVWAMGILLYEMMALKRPFQGQGMRALMDSVVAGQIPPLPAKFSNDLKEVVMLMLEPDPNIRPNTTQLFHLPQMQRLLSNFEISVKTSALVTEETKAAIQESIREIRDTPVSDTTSGTTTGSVGKLQLGVQFEGAIRKESQKVWKDRYLILRNGELIIALKKGEKESKPLLVTSITSVVPVPFSTARSDGVFAINTGDDKMMWLQAATRQECYEWIHKIQQAMGVA